MCISFAVMLPVGNPPNAIVFSYGHCQIKDMVSLDIGHILPCFMQLQHLVPTFSSQ